jgi:hypothetical protein
MPEKSDFDFKMDIGVLKEHKSPCIYQITRELIKALEIIIALRSINVLILFGIRSNCMRNGRSR